MTTTDDIFALEPGNTPAFERTALETFRFQADPCAVYREYLDRIGVIPAEVTRIEQIRDEPAGIPPEMRGLPARCDKWKNDALFYRIEIQRRSLLRLAAAARYAVGTADDRRGNLYPAP